MGACFKAIKIAVVVLEIKFYCYLFIINKTKHSMSNENYSDTISFYHYGMHVKFETQLVIVVMEGKWKRVGQMGFGKGLGGNWGTPG